LAASFGVAHRKAAASALLLRVPLEVVHLNTSATMWRRTLVDASQWARFDLAAGLFVDLSA
jgi:hypothetical protein